jgi:hypothetical protein
VSHGPAAREIRFASPLPLTDAAAAVLEEYAVALTRAERAQALRGDDEGETAPVEGLLLVGLPEPLREGAERDVEDFASGLAEGRRGGLGWS